MPFKMGKLSRRKGQYKKILASKKFAKEKREKIKKCSEVCMQYRNSNKLHELGRLLEASHSGVRHRFEEGTESSDDVSLIIHTLAHYGHIEVSPPDEVSRGDAERELGRVRLLRYDGQTGQCKRWSALEECSPAKAQPYIQTSPDCLQNKFAKPSEQACELQGQQHVESQNSCEAPRTGNETLETITTISKQLHSTRSEFETSECTYVEQLHKRINSNERQHICSECGKNFTLSRSLERHMMIHSNERPFVCSECGKAFTQKSILKEHMRIHTKERPFACSECGKSFTQHGAMKIHMRIHTNERPFACSECGKTFTRSSRLKEHMSIHTNEKAFACSECGKSFTQHCTLKRHMRIHTNEKPFACSECGKSFTQHGTLKGHMRIHSNERPYACNECGKAFIWKSNLKAHMVTHSKKRLSYAVNVGKSLIELQSEGAYEDPYKLNFL